MVTNTGRTKILQTKEKVIRLQSINEQLILEYGTFKELNNQQKLFRSTNEDRERYRKSYNEYSKYMRNQKFIKNNFASLYTKNYLNQNIHPIVRLYSVNPTTTTAPVEASTLQPLPVSLIGTNTTQSLGDMYMEEIENTEPTTNNERTSNKFQDNVLREEIIDYRNSLNESCANCRRKQSQTLVENYGDSYVIDFRRYDNMHESIYIFNNLFYLILTIIFISCLHSLQISIYWYKLSKII